VEPIESGEKVKVVEQVLSSLQSTGIPFEMIRIDPQFSDTAQFCAQYGFPLTSAANAIVLSVKKEPRCFVACLVLATTRIDVNKKVRELVGAKSSFATPEETFQLTQMEMGAVTPFGLPPEIPIYVDDRVLQENFVIMGAGERSQKIKVSPQALLALPQVQVIAGLAKARE
jgi:prolyl-tRNA editing enzyme YbaK/EbsC (Cys-tRNA(Pro) deacylase)